MKRTRHTDFRKKQSVSNVRHILSKVFQKLNLNVFEGSLTTITDVQFSADMKQAHIYVSTLNHSCKESLLNHLHSRTEEISIHLNREIRHQFRYMPQIRFYIDDTPERAGRIDRLLEGLKKK